MFSSADGYCSAAVFSDGELGVKYEKVTAEQQVEEYDVEMMDIATNNDNTNNNTNNTASIHEDRVAKPQKRRVSIISPDIVKMNATATTATTAPIMEKPKKRRVTPILISTPPTTIVDPSPSTTNNTQTNK
jgi:hypothetical protein